MKLRSFLAIEIPDTIKSEIISNINRKVTGAPGAKGGKGEEGGVRWLGPEQLHVTIRFLGEVDEELLLGDLSARVLKVTEGHRPITIAVRGCGVFPDLARPRVLWVGLVGDLDRLAALSQEVEKAVACFPVHREAPRRFSPHVTIARVKFLKERSWLGAWLQDSRDLLFGTFVAKELVLFKSELTRNGARYSKMTVFPFLQEANPPLEKKGE